MTDEMAKADAYFSEHRDLADQRADTPRTESSVVGTRSERGLRPLARRMRAFAAARSQDGEEATASVIEGWAALIEAAAEPAAAEPPDDGAVYYCQTCGKTRMVEWPHRECPPDERMS